LEQFKRDIELFRMTIGGKIQFVAEMYSHLYNQFMFVFLMCVSETGIQPLGGNRSSKEAAHV